jgi:hypothetical protein
MILLYPLTYSKYAFVHGVFGVEACVCEVRGIADIWLYISAFFWFFFLWGIEGRLCGHRAWEGGKRGKLWRNNRSIGVETSFLRCSWVSTHDFLVCHIELTCGSHRRRFATVLVLYHIIKDTSILQISTNFDVSRSRVTNDGGSGGGNIVPYVVTRTTELGRTGGMVIFRLYLW